MSLELVNTSAPRGVRPGSSGFCTVGMTAGISPALEERLTLLSGYRWMTPSGKNGAGRNPTAYSHWRLRAGERTVSILSRVCDAGFDYSRRANRLAHHVILESEELAEPGPAWVMMQPGVLRESWTGDPTIFPQGPDIPQGHTQPRVCTAWASACGDAGWAGVLAEAFVRDPSRVAWIIYPPEMEMLPLLDEAIALLPAAVRWQVTFCTYFTDLPAGMDCAWRFCAVGSRAAVDAIHQPDTELRIDLTQRLPPAPESYYVEAARSDTAIAYEDSSRGVLANIAGKSAFDFDSRAPDRPAVCDEPFTDLSTPSSPTQSPATLPRVGVETEISETQMSREPKDAGGPPVPRYEFWFIATAWPLIVAFAATAYLHHSHSAEMRPLPPGTTAPPEVAQPARQAADDPAAIPIAEHVAATQALQTAEQAIADRDRTIAQLRDAIAELKDDLAAARIRAKGSAEAQAELDALRAEYAALQEKVAGTATTQPSSRASQ